MVTTPCFEALTIGFHLGMKALNNIYLDFYDSNNSKTSCS